MYIHIHMMSPRLCMLQLTGMISICKYTHIFEFIQLCRYINICVYIYAYTYIHIHIYTCIYIYIYIYMCRENWSHGRTRIKQPKLNLVTVGRDSSFPLCVCVCIYYLRTSCKEDSVNVLIVLIQQEHVSCLHPVTFSLTTLVCVCVCVCSHF